MKPIDLIKISDIENNTRVSFRAKVHDLWDKSSEGIVQKGELTDDTGTICFKVLYNSNVMKIEKDRFYIFDNVFSKVENGWGLIDIDNNSKIMEDDLDLGKLERVKIQQNHSTPIKLNNVENNIIKLLEDMYSNNDGILQSDLWKTLDISSRKCSRILQKLEEQGKIKRTWVSIDGSRTYRISIIRKSQVKKQDVASVMPQNIKRVNNSSINTNLEIIKNYPHTFSYLVKKEIVQSEDISQNSIVDSNSKYFDENDYILTCYSLRARLNHLRDLPKWKNKADMFKKGKNCEICGQTDFLEIHHKTNTCQKLQQIRQLELPYHEEVRRIEDWYISMENCIVLCRYCHDELHNNLSECPECRGYKYKYETLCSNCKKKMLNLS